MTSRLANLIPTGLKGSLSARKTSFPDFPSPCNLDPESYVNMLNVKTFWFLTGSLALFSLTGCVVRERPAVVYRTAPPPPVIYQPAPPPQVVYAPQPGQPMPPSGPPPGTIYQPSTPPPGAMQQPQVVEQQPIIVQSAPPAPIVEAVPVSPGVEFVWTPGYWGWNGRWVWMSGRWAHPPRGHSVWVRGGWNRHGGGYRWEPGRWR